MAQQEETKSLKFYRNLKRLLSGQVIVRHIPDSYGKLKVIDSDNIQKALDTDKFSKI